MSNRIVWIAAACQLGLACAGSASGGVSVEDAELALHESALTAQLDAVMASAADVSSHFAVGQSLDEAARQLASYLRGQLPCAAITQHANTLDIVYDAASTACSYRGHSWSGHQTLQILRNADNEVSVHQALEDLRSENLALSGSADVTWSRTSGSRHVVHSLTFETLSGPNRGQIRHSIGDTTQTTTDDTVRINGMREWSSDLGPYTLDMFAVEQRFADCVPQSGAYELTTPTGEPLSLAFGRIDTDTIRVTVQGAQQALTFVVRGDGSIEP